MDKRNESNPPQRSYFQAVRSGTNLSSPKGMIPVSFTADECLALIRIQAVLSTDKPVIFLKFSPDQITNEVVKTERRVAYSAFKKIRDGHPYLLDIDESKQVVMIPNEAAQHLIELINKMKSTAERASQGKAAAVSSPSAKYATPGGSSWADIAAWPLPMTPALQQRKKLTIEALNEISEVIPEDLKSNYRGKSSQLFPSVESPTILVGLMYFRHQFHVLEILHKASDELK